MAYDELRPRINQSSPRDKGMVVYTTGTIARTMSRGDGIRKFLAFKVSMECQLTPLAETSEIFEFYLYQEDGPGAMKIAGQLLKAWFQRERKPFDRFPKPCGHGEARRIEDGEFISTFRQARDQGKEMRVNGDPNDPVAFVLRKPKQIIIIPTAAETSKAVNPAPGKNR